MSNKTKKTPLKELGAGPNFIAPPGKYIACCMPDFIAPPGKYIACCMPDSCIHQIGDPTDDRESAFILCSEYRGMDVGVQIFDDKGEGHIVGGMLKPMEQ